MTDLTGGCACGAVRFTASGEPRFAFICQCTDCQKMTGSGNAAQFCHDADRFAVEGTAQSFARVTGSGNTVTKFFCGECGCPLWGTTSRSETIVMVMAGALDDPSSVSPDRIFFHDEAQPWDNITVPERQ